MHAGIVPLQALVAPCINVSILLLYPVATRLFANFNSPGSRTFIHANRYESHPVPGQDPHALRAIAAMAGCVTARQQLAIVPTSLDVPKSSSSGPRPHVNSELGSC